MNVQLPLFEKAASHVARIDGSSDGGFDLDKFVDSFEVLAAADGGIKKLREFVLALAVRGCLVRQVPEDGTSNALVAELAARRSKLSLVARVRTDLVEVSSEEQPFSVPSSWRWLRLGHFGGFLGGGTPTKSNTSFWNGSIPWVSPKDMKRPYIEDTEDHISEAAVKGSAVKLVPRRSLLFVVRGMILAHSFPVAMTTKEVTINQDMKALVLTVSDTDEYLLRACWAARSRVLQRVERSSHGTCRLESEVVEDLPIPVPPLAEQKRIVVKVDELTRLLDDLVAKQMKKRETQARLRTAALSALTSAVGSEELEGAWKRVAGNFDLLFEGAESIGAMREVVLALAVRGRLVPPDLGLSPVVLSDELERLDASDLPITWIRVAAEGICWLIIDGDHNPPARVAEGVPHLTAKNVRDGKIDMSGCSFISPDSFKSARRRYSAQPNDVLLTCVGTLGRTAIVRNEVFSADRNLAVLRPRLDLVHPRYLEIILMGPDIQHLIATSSGSTAQPHIYLNDIRKLPCALPPLAEQKRILAKVEQLMKLCNELEAKLQRSEAVASKLVEAVVTEMVA